MSTEQETERWQGNFQLRKQHQLDRKRYKRLMSKMQRARTTDRMSEVLEQPSWNKRFGRAARLRTLARQ